jgi:hypothetical protein
VNPPDGTACAIVIVVWGRLIVLMVSQGAEYKAEANDRMTNNESGTFIEAPH